MAKIKVMDKNLRNLIAAGEVVERPASVVKELLENSIDAGATFITIEIAKGGRTLIRVTDNGCGISRDDVELAFVSHATSKIKEEEDLDSIMTLGFRGEALSSIATVSKVTLLTKTANEDFGTSAKLMGGEITDISEAGAPDGTTIIIEDLFFNTPARMKFLKSDMGEGNAVAGIVDKIAVSHPEISFKFIKDNKTIYQTSGNGNLRDAIISVYGKSVADSLIEVDYTHDGIKVTGLTSKPIESRKSRNMQNFFLNGRYIKTKTGFAALDEAYKNSIMVGKHPICFLNIIIPANRVDVNVHPAKVEVRFDNEQLIFDAVRYAVKTALSEHDTRPQMKLNSRDNFKNILRENEGTPIQKRMADAIFKALDETPKETSVLPKTDYTHQTLKVNSDSADYQKFAPTPIEDFANDFTSYPDAKPNAKEEIITQTELTDREEPDEQIFVDEDLSKDSKPLKFVGEAFDTYIIAEYGKDLLFIDKHAAHERLIFERLKRGEIDDGGKQLLLEPMSIILPKNEYNAILDNRDLLNNAGFEVDDFGDGTVLLRSIPSILIKEDAKSTLEEIADRLINNKKDITTEKLDWIYHSISCRSAIKGGNKSTTDELIKVARDALSDDIMYCPHGRPIAIVLKKSEIEKQFGRIQ
jgi:DNA mismatch repair protein MutL